MTNILKDIRGVAEIDHEFLYLCGASGVRRNHIRERGITCIINCSNNEIANLQLNDVEFLNVNVNDSPHSLISEHFDSCADKIEEHRKKGGKVLVHCMAGISRSASVVLAYLVRYREMSLKDAYILVRKKRPIIQPNFGFWKQLIEFEKQIHNNESIKMVSIPAVFGLIPDVYADELQPNWREMPKRKSLVDAFRTAMAKEKT